MPKLLYIPMLAGALLLAAGCQTPAPPRVEAGAIYDRDGIRTPLAMNSDSLDALFAVRPPHADAWQVGRNDQQRAVASGYQSVTIDQAARITVDRQHISGGRAHNHYRETTYRRHYSETVR